MKNDKAKIIQTILCLMIFIVKLNIALASKNILPIYIEITILLISFTIEIILIVIIIYLLRHIAEK